MTRVLHLLAAALLLTVLPGCQSPEKKKKAAEAPKVPDMPDASSDVSYQAFLGKLRKAVTARDAAVLASMMTPNFGYLLAPEEGYSGEGEGVFRYWEENGLWPELQAVVNERFVPLGSFMVAPPQFATNPGAYHGYRAGLTRVRGSWKFAYFVIE